MAIDLNLDQYTQSRFIKGRDVPEGLFLTISDVTEETFRDGTSKPCLSFADDDRQVALGAQNLKKLIAAFGPRTSQWVGRTVLLTAGPEYQGNPSLLLMPQMPKNGNGNGARAAQHVLAATADEPF